MAGDVSLGKASPRICEKILPFALECFVLLDILEGWIVFEEQVSSSICLKAATPFAEGSRVVYKPNTAQGGSIKQVKIFLRAAWFSTPSRVNLPSEPVFAASINALALGKHELGHM